MKKLSNKTMLSTVIIGIIMLVSIGIFLYKISVGSSRSVEMIEKNKSENNLSADMDSKQSVESESGSDYISDQYGQEYNVTYNQVIERSIDNFNGTDEMKALIIDLLSLEKNIMEFYEIDSVHLTLDQISQINEASLTLIRNKTYDNNSLDKKSFMWQILAGETPKELLPIIDMLKTEYVASEQSYSFEDDSGRNIIPLTNSVKKMYDYKNIALTKDSVDFPHMIASISCFYHDAGFDDDIELLFDIMAGWGGDLLSFSNDIQGYTSYADLEAYIYEYLGTYEESNFDITDLRADIDAVNLSKLLITHNLLLSQALLWYYDSWTTQQINDFVDFFGGQSAFEEYAHLILFSDDTAQEELTNVTIDFVEAKGVIDLFKDEFDINTLTSSEASILLDIFLQKIYLIQKQ